MQMLQLWLQLLLHELAGVTVTSLARFAHFQACPTYLPTPYHSRHVESTLVNLILLQNA